MNARQRRKFDRQARRLLGTWVQTAPYPFLRTRVGRLMAFGVGSGQVVVHFPGRSYGIRFALRNLRPADAPGQE